MYLLFLLEQIKLGYRFDTYSKISNFKKKCTYIPKNIQWILQHNFLEVPILQSLKSYRSKLFYLITSCYQRSSFSKRSWKRRWQWRISTHGAWEVHLQPPINAFSMKQVTTIRKKLHTVRVLVICQAYWATWWCHCFWIRPMMLGFGEQQHWIIVHKRVLLMNLDS